MTDGNTTETQSQDTASDETQSSPPPPCVTAFQQHWPYVVGAVSIALGLNEIFNWLTTVVFFLIRMGWSDLLSSMGFAALFSGGEALRGGSLMLAGILCWKKTSITRFFHLTYVVLSFVGVFFWFRSANYTLSDMVRLKASAGDYIHSYLPILHFMIYPIVVLAWMFRPVVRAEVARWRVQEDLDKQKDEPADSPKA